MKWALGESFDNQKPPPTYKRQMLKKSMVHGEFCLKKRQIQLINAKSSVKASRPQIPNARLDCHREDNGQTTDTNSKHNRIDMEQTIKFNP